MLKLYLSLFFLSIYVDSYAQNIITQNNQEYIYIKPISIELAPLQKDEVYVPIDSDNDGIADVNDKCPNTLSDLKVDKNGCVVLNDEDGDGVSDKNDICPNTLQGAIVDSSGCEIDSDKDGIVDSQDQCPATSEDFEVDGYGCPQTATLAVTFSPNKSNVDDKLISQLEDFALFLKNNPGYDVIIYGYTDNLGNASVNKELSQKRAEAVKEALTRYSINPLRMTAIGKGELDPVADNATPEGRAKNRRIEIELLQ